MWRQVARGWARAFLGLVGVSCTLTGGLLLLSELGLLA